MCNVLCTVCYLHTEIAERLKVEKKNDKDAGEVEVDVMCAAWWPLIRAFCLPLYDIDCWSASFHHFKTQTCTDTYVYTYWHGIYDPQPRFLDLLHIPHADPFISFSRNRWGHVKDSCTSVQHLYIRVYVVLLYMPWFWLASSDHEEMFKWGSV